MLPEPCQVRALRSLRVTPGCPRTGGVPSPAIIVAEVGLEMQRCPSAGHRASWVGIFPGNHQNAGKQVTGKTRKGDRWLPQALIEAAHGAMRAKDTYLRAQGQRLTRRRGKKRAVVAVAHSLLIMDYHLLQRHEPYKDLGSTYFDERERGLSRDNPSGASNASAFR
jgi:transposase